MEMRKKGNGGETFLEHWGLALLVPLVGLAGSVFLFALNLRGKLWVVVLVASFAWMILGGVLIMYAKLPAYRCRQFFTFGVKSVPVHLAAYYRWGWRVFLVGLVLALGLLLSKA